MTFHNYGPTLHNTMKLGPCGKKGDKRSAQETALMLDNSREAQDKFAASSPESVGTKLRRRQEELEPRRAWSSSESRNRRAFKKRGGAGEDLARPTQQQ